MDRAPPCSGIPPRLLPPPSPLGGAGRPSVRCAGPTHSTRSPRAGPTRRASRQVSTHRHHAASRHRKDTAGHRRIDAAGAGHAASSGNDGAEGGVGVRCAGRRDEPFGGRRRRTLQWALEPRPEWNVIGGACVLSIGSGRDIGCRCEGSALPGSEPGSRAATEHHEPARRRPRDTTSQHDEDHETPRANETTRANRERRIRTR